MVRRPQAERFLPSATKALLDGGSRVLDQPGLPGDLKRAAL